MRRVHLGLVSPMKTVRLTAKRASSRGQPISARPRSNCA